MAYKAYRISMQISEELGGMKQKTLVRNLQTAKPFPGLTTLMHMSHALVDTLRTRCAEGCIRRPPRTGYSIL